MDLYVRGRDITAFAESILDEEAVAARIGDYLRRVPLSARPLGARVAGGVLNPDDVARLAKERLFVKICLS